MVPANRTDSSTTMSVATPDDPRGRNALKQGAFASPTAIVPGEDPRETPELLEQFEAHFAPQPGPVAEAVRNLTWTAKRLRRVDRAMEAYFHRAVETAQQDLPDQTKQLDAQVRDTEVENTLAARLLEEIALACPDPAHAARKLAAYAPVLDPLLNLPQPINEMSPVDAVIRGNEVLVSRDRAIEPFKKALAEAKELHRIVAEQTAAVESVTSATAERLSRERASLTKAFQRGVQALTLLQDGTITERMVIERKTPKQKGADLSDRLCPRMITQG